ncbi:MAG TPA: KpsF/GutQ family sugar-phosphate isomerase [Coxiellaceae bacterium]|nr:KpsF/GutQ family sugar-phosphate isomerase [Coxiellaceae bacterium]
MNESIPTLTSPTTFDFCRVGRAVVHTEYEALVQLEKTLGPTFHHACELILKGQGRLIVMGMGKSGHIGRKMAATFASTGTPAFYLHPAEMTHGDLGMITEQDVILAISYSGETVEILDLLPHLKRLKAPLIAISCAGSTLAKAAAVNINIKVPKEAGQLGLAPTASTTAALAVGDALAIAVSEAKGFTQENFSIFHPGGMLGKHLLLQVSHIMHTGEQMPLVEEHQYLDEVLVKMTEKRLGLAVVVNSQGELVGIYTDGDIRRTVQQKIDFRNIPVGHVMSKECKTIEAETKAADALAIMEQFKITSLVIVNTQNQPEGVIHLHDLLQLGFSIK